MKYLILCIFLASCGGGGSEDPQKTIMPIDCGASGSGCV